MSIATITPATESAKARLASRLLSNFSAFTADFPRRDGVLPFTARPSSLIDLHYDRRDRHTSGKGESEDHSDEYHFHWIIPCSAAYRNEIMLNIRMLFLRENTYHSAYSFHAGASSG